MINKEERRLQLLEYLRPNGIEELVNVIPFLQEKFPDEDSTEIMKFLTFSIQDNFAKTGKNYLGRLAGSTAGHHYTIYNIPEIQMAITQKGADFLDNYPQKLAQKQLEDYPKDWRMKERIYIITILGLIVALAAIALPLLCNKSA